MTKRSLLMLYECVGYNDFENDKQFGKKMNELINNVKFGSVFYDSDENKLEDKYKFFMTPKHNF
jgi:hypothetical protein